MNRKPFHTGIAALAIGALLVTACSDSSPTDPSQTASFQGCNQVIAYSIGSTVNASLTNSDCGSINRSGRFAKFYGFSLQSERAIRIDMMSDDIDSYLYLWNRDGTLITQDDDGGNWLDARINRTLPAGDYVIEATTFGTGETGPFQLVTQ